VQIDPPQPDGLPGSWPGQPGPEPQSFPAEFRGCWRQLPNKDVFFALLLAWLALFQFLGNSTFGYVDTASLFYWMWNAYSGAGSDDAHGPLVALLVLGLFWWKRKTLLAARPRLWFPGLLLLGLGLLLHILGYAVQQPRVSIVGLLAGLYGLMGLAWGPAWLRASFFPFFLLAFCVPISSIMGPISFRLQLVVSRLVEIISHFVLGTDIIRNGNILRDPTGRYQYEVAAACSGIRSLLAIFALATVYAFVFFRQPWKRLILLASAAPLAVLGNLVRMLLIILAAEMGGQAYGNFVHENTIFSLVPYVPAFAGLFTLGYLLEGRHRRRERSRS
jgi:exosortase